MEKLHSGLPDNLQIFLVNYLRKINVNVDPKNFLRQDLFSSRPTFKDGSSIQTTLKVQILKIKGHRQE